MAILTLKSVLFTYSKIRAGVRDFMTKKMVQRIRIEIGKNKTKETTHYRIFNNIKKINNVRSTTKIL